MNFQELPDDSEPIAPPGGVPPLPTETQVYAPPSPDVDAGRFATPNDRPDPTQPQAVFPDAPAAMPDDDEPAGIQFTEQELRGPLEFTPDEDASLDADIREGWKRAVEVGGGVPDQIAFARKAGLPLALVQENWDGFKRSFEAANLDPKKWREENPFHADIIRQRPELGEVVVRDEQLSPLTKALKSFFAESTFKSGTFSSWRGATLADVKTEAERAEEAKPKQVPTVTDPSATGSSFDKLSAAWRQGKTDSEQRQLGWDLLRADLAGEDTQSIRKRLAEIELNSAPRYYNASPVEQVGIDALSTLPSVLDALKFGGLSAAIAGGATYAATKSPQLAGKVAAVAAQAGGGVASFEMESGSAYVEMLREDIDPSVARGAALVYGALAAVVEVGIGEDISAWGPLGDAVRHGTGLAFLKQGVKNTSMRAFLKDVGVRLGKGALGEAKEEATQEILGELSKWTAKSITKGEVQNLDIGSLSLSAAEAAGRAFTSSIGLFGPMGAANAVQQIGISGIQKQFDTRPAGKADALVSLPESDLIKAAPEAVAAVIAKAAEQGGDQGQALYADPKVLAGFFQSQNVDPEAGARELLGEQGALAIREAEARGVLVEIPMATYLEKMHGKPIAAVLKGNVSLVQARTTEQIRADTEEEKVQAKKVADDFLAQEEKGEGPAETPAETAQLDALFDGLVASGKYDQKQAQHIVDLHRARIHTAAARSGISVDEVVRMTPVSVDAEGKARTVRPSATKTEFQQAAKPGETLSAEERARDLYVDPVSGLKNIKGWEAAPRQAGKKIAVITTPDAKALNDDPRGGHDTTNELLRVIGREVGGIDPGAARKGTNFLLEVADEAELVRAVSRIQKALPEGLRVVGALGSDRDQAFVNLDRTTDEQRAAGTLPARGQTSFDLSKLDTTVFSEGRAAENLSSELVAKAGDLTEEAFGREAYQDPDIPGLLNKTGFEKSPAKKYVAALDLKGLKKINALGKDVGDRVIRALGLTAQRLNGASVYFAHLSGDEFAAKHDNPEDLKAFLDDLQGELMNVGVPATFNGEEILVHAEFRDGIGEGSYGAADRDLNAKKRAETNGVPGALGRDGSESERQGGGSRRDVAGRVSLEERRAAAERRRAEAQDGRDRRQAGREEVGKTTLEQTKGEDPRGRVEILKNGAERAYRVLLGKKADLSTFLHESGHIYLDMMEQLAAREDAPLRVKADLEIVRKELGAVAGKPLAEQVEVHEKFARGFELYLRTGKSPSRKLARAFQAFSLWLKGIYKSVRQLNAEVSEDLAGVFDRLLAADEEIEAAHRQMGGGPMFATHEEMGVSPGEFQKYLESEAQARSTTETRARLRVLKDQARESETWWKTELSLERKAAAEEYEQRPDVRALRYLKTGVLQFENGTQVFGDGEKKLSREAVRAMGGDAALRGLAAHVSDSGLNPDDVAEHFGYPTGRELIDALLAVPEDGQAWAVARANERMQEKHPDVLAKKDELREIIAKGLHGDYTADRLIAEVRALEVKTDPSVTASGVAMPIESQRRIHELAAREIVSRRAVRKLDAGSARRAEQTAAKNALLAAAKGNYAQALVFKRQQLLNLYVFRELAEAREERDRFEQTAADLRKVKSRQRLGKASPVYRDAVDGILGTLGLRDGAAPFVSAQSVADQMEADGQTVGFDVESLGQLLAQAKDWRALTVSQMRDVHEALNQIRQAAANKTTALVDGKREEREKIIEQLIVDALKNESSKGQIPSSESAATLGQKIVGAWTAFDGALLKPETMAGWLGGGNENSAWFRAIVKPLQDAKAKEVDLLNSVMKPVIEAFEAMPKEARARANDKVDGQKLFPGHGVKSGQNISPPTRRFEILMMALNAGNASNLKRLTEGRGITEKQVLEAIDQTLTKEEMDWVQSVWDASDSMWNEASALEERDSGISPEKIPAKPVVTKHGVYRGGYFPAIYDRRVEQAGERQVANAVASLMDPSFSRGDTARSHLKSRVDNFSGAISLEPSSIPRHLAQVAHDIAFREAVKSVGGLLLDPEIQATMKDRIGDGRAKQFVQWVKDVGQMRGVEGFTHSGILLKATRQIRANTVIAALGYSVPNMIEDLSNLVAAVPRSDLKAKHLVAGLAQFMASPRESAAIAHEKSGELRTRREQLQRELQRQVGNMTKSGPFARGPLEFMRHHAFALMEASDFATSTPIWMGAYRQGLAGGMNEKAAVTHADATVRKVFPSHSAVDMAAILRDKGFIGTSITFYGFLSTYYNGLRDIGHGFAKKSAIEQAKIGGRLIGYVVAVGVLSEFLRGRGREPGEEWSEWFLRKALVSPLASIPYGGDVANAIEGKLLGKRTNPRVTSLVGTATSLGEAALNLQSNTKTDGEKAAGLLRAVGPVVGVPTSQFARSLQYLYETAEGQRPIGDPLDFLGGVIYGERKGQPANPLRDAR